MKKPVIFTMTEEVYKPQVVIAYGTNFDEFYGYINKRWELDPRVKEELEEGWGGKRGTTYEIKTTNEGILFAIWFDTEDFGFGVLAHEAFHLVCSILRTKGMSLSEASEEGFAYYMEFWARQIAERLKLK